MHASMYLYVLASLSIKFPFICTMHLYSSSMFYTRARCIENLYIYNIILFIAPFHSFIVSKAYDCIFLSVEIFYFFHCFPPSLPLSFSLVLFQTHFYFPFSLFLSFSLFLPDLCFISCQCHHHQLHIFIIETEGYTASLLLSLPLPFFIFFLNLFSFPLFFLSVSFLLPLSFLPSLSMILSLSLPLFLSLSQVPYPSTTPTITTLPLKDNKSDT